MNAVVPVANASIVGVVMMSLITKIMNFMTGRLTAIIASFAGMKNARIKV